MNFTEVKERIIKPGLGITPPEVDAKKERIQDRGERSKVWDLGGNKRRCIVGIKALHYKDDPTDKNEQFKDIDLTLLSDRSCHKTQYDIQVYDDKVGFSYTSKRGGRLDFELLEIDGVAVDNRRFNITQNGNQLFWNNVADDVDMKVMLRSQSAELYKQLKTATAAKTFKWKIEKWKNSKCDFQRELSGIDSTAKAGRLEINTNVILDKKATDRDIYFFEEEWTGRLSRIVDLETRIREWKEDPVYPVMIDAVANEEVSADADDCWEAYDTSFKQGGTYLRVATGETKKAGMRFASVGVPQGATITSAVMGMYMQYGYIGIKPKVYFEEVTNAPAWSAGNRPSQMGNKVPAGGIAWTPAASGSNFLDTLGVTNAIQIIVSQGGWSSGNALRCMVSDPATAGFGQQWAAAEHATQPPVQLDITYSVGAGGLSIPLLMQQMDHFNGGMLNG